MDLYWTSNLICPSVNEYFQMIERSRLSVPNFKNAAAESNSTLETGGLVRLFGRLMALHSTSSVHVDIVGFSNRLGRYFQTRDDYQNLVSAEVGLVLLLDPFPGNADRITNSTPNKKASVRTLRKESSPFPLSTSCKPCQTVLFLRMSGCSGGSTEQLHKPRRRQF